MAGGGCLAIVLALALQFVSIGVFYTLCETRTGERGTQAFSFALGRGYDNLIANGMLECSKVQRELKGREAKKPPQSSRTNTKPTPLLRLEAPTRVHAAYTSSPRQAHDTEPLEPTNSIRSSQ